MQPHIAIRQERLDQPDMAALLDSSDRNLVKLWPLEANHIRDVQALLAPEVTFFVAREDARIVCTGAFRRLPGEPNPAGQRYGEIKRMVVDPARCGQRMGAQFLSMFEATLRGEGCRLELLETDCDQTEAVRLYQRGGHAARAAFGSYCDNGFSVFYGKAL